MTKQEYIKKYVEKLEKKLNEITNAYDFDSYPECESCPLHKDGEWCGGCIDTFEQFEKKYLPNAKKYSKKQFLKKIKNFIIGKKDNNSINCNFCPFNDCCDGYCDYTLKGAIEDL